ncbi:MAG: class I SAM-dependent methyltransferase [Prevotellaceae bacterium]|jgi:2-polyprenyl-3-methyl-5-hydroxy-6-metoxy-1,4-benzoquinol methylase|nr:class I SAM-dependent methyltransferase [Prevotellaceae bacterium]
MQKRHKNTTQYFAEQAQTTREYIIPFIEKARKIDSPFSVLEIGCGEAGNLFPFAGMGCRCVGIDYSERKIEQAKKNYAGHLNSENISLVCSDIYDSTDDFGTFDLVIVRDVIEHIHGHKRFLAAIKKYMHAQTLVLFAFPPWQNPFGGHQQMCKSAFLSKLPYFHLLPKNVYAWLMKIFGEEQATIDGLLEIKETRISIEDFERAIRENYVILQKTLYFINPNYQVKFGLKPRKLWNFAAKINYFRNFYCTCGYYLLQTN